MDIEAEQTGQRIMGEQGSIINRLIRTAERIASDVDGELDYRFDALIDVAERVSQLITPYTPCKDGCNHCCYMAVAVSDIEAQAIGRFLGRDPAVKGTQEEYMLAEGHQEDYRGVACSMLAEDGKCSIYPVRPVPCRLHHNLKSTSDNCKLVGRPEPDVTWSLNLQPISIAGASVTLQAGLGFADIREFFPRV